MDKRTEKNLEYGSKMHIFIKEPDWSAQGYQMGILIKDEIGSSAVQPLLIKRLEEGDYVGPCATFQKQDLQSMFNELWRLGFRPSDGTGNSGHIEALTYHLEDMRRIVFYMGDKK